MTGAPDIRALDGVEVFAGLTDRQKAELLVGMTPFAASAGEVLWVQGDPSGPLYVLTAGRVHLSVRVAGEDSAPLPDVRAGQVVGTFGLVDRGPRSATATVAEDVTGLLLPAAVFDTARAALRPAAYALLRPLAHELAADARALIDVMAGTSTSGQATLPADYRQRFDIGAPTHRRTQLEGLPAFAGFATEELDRLLEGARWLDVPRGEVLIGRGEAAGALGIVVRGAVQGSVEALDGSMLRLPLTGPGDTMGEIARLDGGPHPVSYVTREPTTVAGLARGRVLRLLDDQDSAGFKMLDLLLATLVATLRRGNRRMVHVQAQQRMVPR